MKPVSQLITKVEDEESSDEEDWPSFTNQKTDQYEQDDDLSYDDTGKVYIKRISSIIPLII